MWLISDCYNGLKYLVCNSSPWLERINSVSDGEADGWQASEGKEDQGHLNVHTQIKIHILVLDMNHIIHTSIPVLSL